MDKHDKKWQENAKIFKDYIKELELIPNTETVYNGFELGKWLSSQISLYKKGKLSNDKINTLNSIYIDWTKIKNVNTIINDIVWECTAELLREFIEEYEHLPESHYNYKGFDIYGWLTAQRRLYNTHKLSEYRINILNDIDSSILYYYTPIEEIWEDRANELRQYLKEFGKMPYRHDIYYHGFYIGDWLYKQRSAYERGKLSEKKLNILNSIYKDWYIPIGGIERVDNTWEINASKLEEYVNEFNKLPYGNIRYKYLNVGNWLESQRLLYKKGELSNDRVNRLNSINRYWIINNRSLNDEEWYKGIKILIDYKAIFNKLPDDDTIYNGFKLGEWLNDLRQKYKIDRSHFYKYKNDILTLLDKYWYLSDDDIEWNNKIKSLKEYIKKHKSLPDEDSDLGKWYIDQKTKYDNDELYLYRKTDISDIHNLLLSLLKKEEGQQETNTKFKNKNYDEWWDNNVTLVEEYIAKFNKLPYVGDIYKGFNIGTWFMDQMWYVFNHDNKLDEYKTCRIRNIINSINL